MTSFQVNQLQTSIAPCALLYALAMVIRKARVCMEKNPKPKPESSDARTTKAEGASEEDKKSNEVASEDDRKSNEVASGSKPDTPKQKKVYKAQTWDSIIRDAYKVARRISLNEVENLFLFTYYLRQIAKSEGKKGFGKGWRETVMKWYNFQPAQTLAESVTKIYASPPWTHADLLKLLRWSKHENEGRKKLRDLKYVLGSYFLTWDCVLIFSERCDIRLC